MSATAERQVGPGLRLGAMGPHRLAGGRQVFARSRELPRSVTLTFDEAEPTVVEFSFKYEGAALQPGEPIVLGNFFEGVRALTAMMVPEVDADAVPVRMARLRLVASHRDDIFGKEALDIIVGLPDALASKTHFSQRMLVASIAAAKVLMFVGSKLLLELKAELERSPE